VARSPVVSSPVVRGLRPPVISAFCFLLSAFDRRCPWSRPAGQWWPLAVPLALFSVLWLNLVRELCFQWSTKEQYGFGWFVPLLALCLAWRRWACRPDPQPFVPPRWVGIIVLAAAAMLLPVQVLCEANPDWPLCSWLTALLVVGLSLYAVLLAGGWRWVLHFAFPIGFILIAVRWPSRIEYGVTDGLMRLVAGVTVNVLGWLDIVSSQRGNLIELSTGAVGIDEACSGIRSFQSTMMAALFLGELYVLSWQRRFWVLAGGMLLAVCFNVVRTLTLTWWASETGVDALQKWHDPAGYSIFGATFACLWLLALRLRKKEVLGLESKVQSQGGGVQSPKSNVQSQGGGVQSPMSKVQSQGGGVQSPMSKVQSPDSAPRPSPLAPPSSVPKSLSPWVPPSRCPRFLLATGFWSVCFVALTEFWYFAHERVGKPPLQWYARLPVTNASFQRVELTPRVQEMLQNKESITGTWKQDSGSDWTVFYLRWDPKSVPSVIRARGHRPDVCLPAAGFREVSNLPIEYFAAGPLKLAFQRYIYEANRQLMYVFFCFWQDGDETPQGMRMRKGLRMLSIPERLHLAWQGRRRLGQQTLEIAISGCESFQKAEQEVRNRLPELVQLESAQPNRRSGG